MSKVIIIPAGENKVCFNISIYDNDVFSPPYKQFKVVFNLTDEKLAIPGMNNIVTIIILDDDVLNITGNK